MGGDDGKLVALDATGEVTLLATDPKRRWIDNVALHPDGAVAWSAGKTAFVRGGKGEDKFFDVPSTVGGLAFAPKGLRLAVAHYNGVTLWFPNMVATAEVLDWAGSHPGVRFNPANQFPTHAGLSLGLERQGHAAGVRHGRWRCRVAGALAGRIARFPREQCVHPSVDLANGMG